MNLCLAWNYIAGWLIEKTQPISAICIHKLPNNNQKSSIITNKWYNPTTSHAIDQYACSINQKLSNMIDIDQSDRGELHTTAIESISNLEDIGVT